MVSESGPLCIITFISHIDPSPGDTRIEEELIGSTRTGHGWASLSRVGAYHDEGVMTLDRKDCHIPTL